MKPHSSSRVLSSPTELLNTGSLFCRTQQLVLILTPLAAAALAGQTALVQLLLEHGAPAAEDRYGKPCVWDGQNPETGTRTVLPFSPLLAAEFGGHRETAELLRRCGAECELRSPSAQFIRRQFRTLVPEKAPQL